MGDRECTGNSLIKDALLIYRDSLQQTGVLSVVRQIPVRVAVFYGQEKYLQCKSTPTTLGKNSKI